MLLDPNLSWSAVFTAPPANEGSERTRGWFKHNICNIGNIGNIGVLKWHAWSEVRLHVSLWLSVHNVKQSSPDLCVYCRTLEHKKERQKLILSKITGFLSVTTHTHTHTQLSIAWNLSKRTKEAQKQHFLISEPQLWRIPPVDTHAHTHTPNLPLSSEGNVGIQL